MKNYNNYILVKISIALFVLLSFTNCTDLDVPIESELTSDNFPETEEHFIALTGDIYSNLPKRYFKSYWFLQEFPADGLILTANGGNWYDDGRYKNYHMHTWNTSQRFIREVWDWCYTGISSSNSTLSLLEKIEESDMRNRTIAEVKTMRAFYYFILMDIYGDVPLLTKFGQEVTTRNSRKEIFEFIEADLLNVVNNLSVIVDQSTYGRPTKYMANALLAKLYINAEVYIKETRYEDAVKACDEIIETGIYSLEDDYLDVFDIDNGPLIKDIIFAVVYDSYDITQQYYARYWVHKGLGAKYSLPYNPTGCVKALPEYYDLFNDPNDRRNDMWLTGKQYYWDGNPVIIETTNSGLDNRYDGDDPNGVVQFHVELTREIEFRSFETFDTGDDWLGKSIGYRCNKFYPDSTSVSRQQNNDWPVFRYADILLTKAEAILRGAPSTLNQTPTTLVNEVRNRCNASEYANIDLDELLNERARELCYEGWRRNDLIRFGKFENPWGFKTDSDPRKRIFPVPQDEVDKNPALGQNPGY